MGDAADRQRDSRLQSGLPWIGLGGRSVFHSKHRINLFSAPLFEQAGFSIQDVASLQPAKSFVLGRVIKFG